MGRIPTAGLIHPRKEICIGWDNIVGKIYTSGFFGYVFYAIFTSRVIHPLRIDCVQRKNKFLSKLANDNHPKKFNYQPHFDLLEHQSSIHKRFPQWYHHRHRHLQRQHQWLLIREDNWIERELHGEIFLGGTRRKYRAPQHLWRVPPQKVRGQR